MEEVHELLGAERATLFLVDREAGELELFGDACRLATANPDVEVQGLQTCFSTAP